MRRPSISVVVPMFNEEENIGRAVAFVTDALEALASAHEIIVVDDASTDRSPEIVRELAERDPRIRLLRHERNRKLGGSLRSGFAAARMDLVLYMDADLAFDPAEIGRAVRAMEITGADMIAAYRHDRTGEGLLRTVYSYAYNGLIGILFRWPHRDVNFSFKLMRREVLEAVRLRSEGSLISAELLVKARNLGFRVQQIGLDYFPRTRGRSTLASVGVILTILRELIALHGEMRQPARASGTRRSADVSGLPVLAFLLVNAGLVIATFGLSWLPVVTRLVDRPVTTAMLRAWLPIVLALCAIVAAWVATRLPPTGRRGFLLRHFGVYTVVPLAYLALRLHPGMHRTELGLLYLWTAVFFAVHVSLAMRREVARWSDRVVGPTIAATAFAVYALVAPYYQASMTPNADEPHYLIVAQSLLADGDLDLRNNYDERRYRAYHPRPLPDRHVIQVGSAQYPIRDIGLPLLALGPFAIAGRLGVLLLQGMLTALLAWQLFQLARDLRFSREASWLAAMLTTLTHPMLTYTTQIYPDTAAVLGLVLALRLISPEALTVRRIAAASALLGTLPWLTIRTWPSLITVGLVMLLFALARSRATSRWASVAAAVIPGGVLVGLLALYHYSLFGLPLPNAGYLLIREQHQVAGNVLVGTAGMLFGRTYGLLSYAPIYLLAFLGSWTLLRSAFVAGPAGVALIAAGVVHLAFNASIVQWHGDWSPPSRNLILALPLLVVGTAAGLDLAARLSTAVVRSLVIGAAAAWTVTTSVLLLSFPENLYNLPERVRASRTSGRLWDFITERVGFDPGALFPSVARIDDSTLWMSVAWTVLIAGLGTAGYLVSRGYAPKARVWPSARG